MPVRNLELRLYVTDVTLYKLREAIEVLDYRADPDMHNFYNEICNLLEPGNRYLDIDPLLL